MPRDTKRRITRLVRTIIVRSARLSRKVFRVITEIEEIYRNIVEQLALYAVGNNGKSYVRLKA